MAGKKGQKKRFWSDDEKRSICGQARVSGVSVAQVARRYGMNANLIHKWLKDERFASEPEADEGALLLPVEVDGGVAAAGAPGTLLAYRVDITLSDGRRILVEGATGLSAVLALVEGLMA